MMTESIELIAGLGNPDPEYLQTRHNAGFWLVDALARANHATFDLNKKLLGETCEVSVAGRRIRLLKPRTYMNESGRSVGAAASYFKIAAENILVVHDEIDFPPGRAQLKFDGGAAGHNGVRSVIAHIGPQFWRLRLGVGHPGNRDAVKGHVLRRAQSDDEDAIVEAIRRSIDALGVFVEDGSARAMQMLHTRSPGEPDDAQPDDTQPDDTQPEN